MKYPGATLFQMSLKIKKDELEGIALAASPGLSTKDQPLPAKTVEEINFEDTVIENQTKDEASIRVEEGDSLETSVSRGNEISPELPVELDLLVQNSPPDISVDKQNSEVMEPGNNAEIPLNEPSSECTVRRSERIRRPPELFHYPTLGTPIISFAQTLLEGFHQAVIDTFVATQDGSLRNPTISNCDVV